MPHPRPFLLRRAAEKWLERILQVEWITEGESEKEEL